ncbi:MAG: copper resistance CopC/CopD family protein [Gemmatimonadaceae bacterium]
MLLHATLLRSSPAANSHLAKPPETIRLVFSEQIVPQLSQITLVRPDGVSTQLQVGTDPHDVRTLVGSVVGSLPSGRYKIVWHVVSADGHPVGGTITFFVATQAEASSSGKVVAPPTVTSTPAVTGRIIHDSTPGDTLAAPSTAASLDEESIPVFAALFRGVGLGALMAGVGVLFFGMSSGEHRGLAPRRFIVSAIAVGAILLVAHLIAWLGHLSAGKGLSGHFIGSVLGTMVGRVELLRTILALLTLWAIALARREKPALVLGAACLVVSGAIGHPAAIDPYWTIPAKMLHLLAASVWIGGLAWLVWLSRCNEAACRIEARRVSSVALIAVIVIALSGLLQTFFFLNTPGDLIGSTYGRLVIAKMTGLAILIGFGAYNRYALLPRLDTDGARHLSRSVKVEIAVLATIILIGGFLAYEPTPPRPTTASIGAPMSTVGPTSSVKAGVGE